MAALGYRGLSPLQYLCAGSLITSRYVLTSAHCINKDLFLVRLGAHNLLKSQDNSESNARNFYIKRTIVHEKFNANAIINDIALIELTISIQMTGKKYTHVYMYFIFLEL